MSPILRMIAYCSIAIWPATVFRFIHRQVPNVPYWDEWDATSVFVALHNGVLTFGDLWAAHNEHRVFCTWLVLLLLDRFGGWDLIREMNVSVVVTTVSVVLLTLLVRRTGPKYAWPFAGFLISAVSFSFVQSENWSWGGTLSTFMVNASVIGVVSLLGRHRTRRPIDLGGAATLGFFASYTLGQGLMIWAAGLVVLLCGVRFEFKAVAVWCAAAAVAFALYSYGMPAIAGHSLVRQLLGNPTESAEYVFAYLGSPLGRWLGLNWAIAVGAVECAVFAALAVPVIISGRRAKRRLLRSSAWIGLGAFPIANALVTVTGRLDLGVGQALSSRYTTTTLLLVVAIIGLIAVRLRYMRPALPVLAPATAAAALIFALNIGCSAEAHLETIASLNMRKLAVTAIGKSDAMSNRLIASYLYPDPAVLRVNLYTLQQIGQARSFAQ